ncbi:hypothetical protein OJF2_31690 [Aquisphaera giovannonii]|uniref:Bacteriophage CI repressor helix-turn-helix domain protein n=1 Tax=Aquisphaera giovannonii TaxID=406548 RepID=A0A5B9W254_9BACT|nr:hypothetical protein [Aquisphaera giovannonii]QEH34628.1 hypothetical protein OJF2_31690 [Aquisphaera giovannonii]
MKPTHADLAARLRLVRRDLYGDDGASAMADALSLPARTWLNYEAGVVLPAGVLLVFIRCTGADARWLLSGEGHPYAKDPREGC